MAIPKQHPIVVGILIAIAFFAISLSYLLEVSIKFLVVGIVNTDLFGGLPFIVEQKRLSLSGQHLFLTFFCR
jgi:hypothetical protein